jgi:hypothetical protein
VTRRPCAAEEELVTRLVGAPIERFAYMPDGDDSCSYRIRRSTAADPGSGERAEGAERSEPPAPDPAPGAPSLDA